MCLRPPTPAYTYVHLNVIVVWQRKKIKSKHTETHTTAKGDTMHGGLINTARPEHTTHACSNAPNSVQCNHIHHRQLTKAPLDAYGLNPRADLCVRRSAKQTGMA